MIPKQKSEFFFAFPSWFKHGFPLFKEEKRIIILLLSSLTLFRSGLFYNTSARYERHGCDTNDVSATRTTRVQHEWYKNDTSASRVLHEQHERDTSATRTMRVRLEREIWVLITTRVRTYFYTPMSAYGIIIIIIITFVHIMNLVF